VPVAPLQNAVFDQQQTRRRVLVGTGTLAAGTVATVALGSNNATATVDGDFTVPDAGTSLAGESLQDVRLRATANWEFSGNARMTSVETELHVGAATDTLDLIARETKDGISKESLTGTTDLSGSLAAASDFDIDDFRPTNGELTQTVIAELRVYVLREDTVEAEDTAQTSFEVTVRDGEISVSGSVGGSGEVRFDTA